MPLIVTWQTPNCLAAAQNLATTYQLSLAKTVGCNSSLLYSLYFTEERLELICHRKGTAQPHRVFVEFLKGPLGYRRLKGGGRNQAIAKAVGLKNLAHSLTVLDATAGLGTDSFVLASLGCHVHLLERSPIIAALLSDGLKRAQGQKETAKIIQKMQLTVEDARKILRDLSNENCPDVVYLDPMFPTRRKNSLTKIEMRIIRDIVGDDMDAPELLSLALLKAKKRVVVKRPRSAPILLGRTPSFLITGKSNRYDIYLTGGNANTSC